MADALPVHVTVMYSPAPRVVHEWPVTLPAGATVLAAMQASGLQAAYPDTDLHEVTAGVWGRRADIGQVLREGDRIECYRPLRVDPKVARRERFREQGARAAGLFAKKKGGSKPAS